MSNPLWQYAVATYRREAVAAACLRLQDEHGADVNLLLYAGWLAARGEGLTSGHLKTLVAEVTPWREGVILPLRALRRGVSALADTGADAIRKGLLELELTAERRQHELMFEFHRRAPALPRDTAAAAANLRLAAGPEAASSTDITLLTGELQRAGAGVVTGQGG